MLTYKLEIGAATYYADRIMPPLSVQKALCNYDALTIGNVCSKTLKVTIIPGNTVINRRAQVKLYSSPAEGTPEWTPRGTFYIDTRRKGINTLSLVCYDAVLMMSNTFIQNNTPAEWPISMRAAIQHICTQLGIEAENINDISDTFMIPYTNTLTMRDVACRIANAHGGNFIINDANKLQFISIVGTDIGICTPIYKNFKILADPYKFAKVIMFYDEQDYYGSLIEDELQAHLDAELPHKMLIDDALHDYGFIQEGVYLKFIVAGTGSYNEFITTNEYATQEIATNVYNTIKNYTHRPYEIVNAIFDDNTILEVGDKFQINNTDYIFFEGRINYGNVISYDMTAPYDQEMIHEYPVTGQYLKEIKRKVSLGTNYYGTTIDRDNGLTIEREDGLSKVIMNSESMKWQVDKGAGLADRLYFDAVAGDLKYNGNLEILQDNNKAKTIINASETAIYGATGAGGALEKNFYVDATGKIVAKNINLAGAITWGAESSPVKVQYSINGSTLWHDTFATGDTFARYSYDGGTTYTSAVKIVGTDGTDGAIGPQGPQGPAGTSVTEVTEYYLATSASSGVTTETSGWTTSIQTITSTNKYLWNYEEVTFSDSTSQNTTPVIVGVYGDTGDTGRSVISVTEYYLATSANSGVTRSTDGWTTEMQATTTTNKYLWNYEKVDWNTGTTPTYVEPIIIGVHGSDGTSTYTYIRYSVNSNGNPMVATPTSLTKYIGICISTSSTAPSTYTSYTWSKYQGDDASVPGYIKETYIDMRSVSSPYIIGASIQGSDYIQYPFGKGYNIYYYDAATSNIFVCLDEDEGLQNFNIGDVVNIGTTRYGAEIAAVRTITNITDYGEYNGASIVGYTFSGAPAYLQFPNNMSKIVSQKMFTIYDEPFTDPTMPPDDTHILGGIEYANSDGDNMNDTIELYSRNGSSLRINSNKDTFVQALQYGGKVAIGANDFVNIRAINGILGLHGGAEVGIDAGNGTNPVHIVNPVFWVNGEGYQILDGVGLGGTTVLIRTS